MIHPSGEHWRTVLGARAIPTGSVSSQIPPIGTVLASGRTSLDAESYSLHLAADANESGSHRTRSVRTRPWISKILIVASKTVSCLRALPAAGEWGPVRVS